MIVSILSSVIIWGIIAVLVLRTAHFSGLFSADKNRVCAFLCADLRKNG